MSYIEYAKAFGHIKYEQMKDKVNSKITPSLKEEQLAILKEINKNGVAVIPNYYSSEKCDLIHSEIDEMNKNSSIKKWYDNDQADSRVFAAHKYSDQILGFHEDSFLREIGEAYTKNELINSHTMAGKIVAKENNLGSGGGWHRDSVYPIQYKSIAYLTDVEENNGPFEYILGSHKKSTILKSILENNFNAHQNRMTPEQVDDFSLKNPDLERQIFTAKKGTVIVVDTSGIHRGMPIKADERYALTNYYFLKHQYTEKIKKKFGKLF